MKGWLADVLGVVLRRRTPELRRVDVSCPCGCGLKLGERWMVER